MPSRLDNGEATSRFELPALDLNFGSITDGTDIPPPPASPILEVHMPLRTPSQVKGDRSHNNASGIDKSPTTNDDPLPTSGSGYSVNVNRPESQSGTSIADDRKSKRTSGWFRRLRSGNHQQSKRRASLFGFEQIPMPAASKKPSGAPPPMIPELISLEKDKGSLGADLFKHIK